MTDLEFSSSAPRSAEALVDYTRSLDCIHCGLCLTTCPTYQLTGAESSSPRGRIHLMRAVAENRIHADRAFADEMNFCLVCRHCESVCPAGVEFGAMMEFTRDGLMSNAPQGILTRIARKIGFGIVLPRRGALRFAISALGLAQRVGITRVLGLFGQRGRALRYLPKTPARADRQPLPAITPARGQRQGGVLVLEGCVMPELYERVNRATVTCLAAAGLDSRVPRDHVCCGALHAHNGDLAGARALARSTITAFEALGEDEVVVNSAGCGAHMKEYGRLLEDDPDWSARATTFAGRVVDFAERLARPDTLQRLLPHLTETRMAELSPVTYDDPCHLCHGQGIRSEPRALIDALPGITKVELTDSESCCGSAGIYSLLRPADSNAILDKKLGALRTSGARTLVTANPGCQLQWEGGIQRAGESVRVLHLAELVALACSPSD